MSRESILHPGLINSDCSPRKGRLILQYYGLEGTRMLNEASGGQYIDRMQRDAVDHEFFQRLIRQYPGQIDGENHATDIYMNQLRHANNIPSYIVNNALPMGYETVFGLRNKVGLQCDSPAELLLQAARSKDKIEKFETHRALLLAELSMRLHMRTKEAKPFRQLRDIDELFEMFLYDQEREAKTNMVVINAAHDNISNAYLGRAGYGNYDNHHFKQHLFQARLVPDIGDVFVHPRKKSDEVSIMKALHKSKQGEAIDIDRVVTDSMGMMFVTLGENGEHGTIEKRTELANKVKQLLLTRYGNEVSINEDHRVDNRSSSNGMNWERYQIILPGQTLPIELQFYTEEDFTNGIFKIGNKGEKNRAHAIYEVERAQAVSDMIFPREIYNGGQYDALYDNGFYEQLKDEKMQATINALRSARKISYDFTEDYEFNFQIE